MTGCVSQNASDYWPLFDAREAKFWNAGEKLFQFLPRVDEHACRGAAGLE
jgi:hypothetical protein